MRFAIHGFMTSMETWNPSGNWPSLRSLLRVHLFTDVYITSLFCSGLVNHQKAVADQVDQLSFGYFRMCVCVMHPHNMFS